MRARSSMALSLRRGRCRRRSACRIRVAAALLTAGAKLMKYLPHRFFDRRERNVYPKKVNCSVGYCPGRSSSLQ